MTNPIASFFRSPTGRRLRVIFRWVRIVSLFAIFLGVVAWGYLHLIGLPDYLKRPLLQELRERGFDVQFTSARLGWGPEVIIEDAAFHRADRPLAARLFAGQTRLHFKLSGFRLHQLKADSLRIAQGSLELPFSKSKDDFLAANHVSLDLDLLEHDTVRLQSGRVTFHGVQIILHGAVTNYLAARDWDWWPSSSPGPTPGFSLRQLAATLDKIHFQNTPRLNLNLAADGRDPDSIRAALSFDASGVQSPWGDATGVKLTAACVRPAHPGSLPFADLRLTATNFDSHQGRGRQIYLTVDLSRNAASNLDAAVSFSASSCQGSWTKAAVTYSVDASRVQFQGHVISPATHISILAASGEWQAVRPVTPWGSADSASITLNAEAVAGSPHADASWGVWAKFNPWSLDWRTRVTNLVTPKIEMERGSLSGRWQAPNLVVDEVQASVFRGQLTGSADLNVDSRELGAKTSFDFDPHQLAKFLPPAVQDWIADYRSPTTPKVSAQARIVLPVWTNAPPDSRTEALSTLQLAGELSAGPSSYRDLSIDSTEARFAYSNRVWTVPRWHAAGTNGDFDLSFTGSDKSDEFQFVVDSRLDPKVARPFLPVKQQAFADQVSFSEPPVIHAEIRGRWHEAAALAGEARVAATNFVAHGEKVDGLVTALRFTNLVLRASDTLVFQDGGQLTAPWMEFDLTQKKIRLSNVVSTLDPHLVTRVLGPKTPPWFRVIGFDTPPTVHLAGSFVLTNQLATDLHFDVSGRNFRYTNLVAGQMSGSVDWIGEVVTVTNVAGALYGGSLQGGVVFDYLTPNVGTDVRGQLFLSEIDLAALVRGWSGKSNQVEGKMTASLIVDGGNTRNLKTWSGRGKISVTNALLWNIRLFGVLSPMLDAIVPGSGHSRAYQAGADFVITNGMVSTSNLEIRSTGFRLLYRGTLNASKELDAKVEAQLLRDTPLFGPLVSLAFAPLSKLFEYKITGTLDAPVHKPLYMPKFLMLILRPFHTLKSLLPPLESLPAENQPAASPKNGK